MPGVEDKKTTPGQADRLESCQKWLKRLNNQYNDLNDKRRESLNHLAAKPEIVAIIDGRSKVTTNDMQDAINKAKPDILETIAGIDEPLKLDPDEGKWVEQVKKLQILGNVMIRRKNQWYRICNDFLDDSMVLKFGCIKYRWLEESKDVVKTYEDLDDTVLQALLLKEGVSIESDERKEGKGITKLRYRMDDEYVRLDAVPAERIKFPLDTRDFAETPMVIEEISLYEHEYIKLFGKEFFDKIKDIKEGLDSEKLNAVYLERFKHLGDIGDIKSHFYDNSMGKYRAYECYFWEDDRPWVMTFAGDEVAIDEENKYGKPPYRGGSAFLVAHSLLGKDYLDYIGKLQEERTYIKRLITDIITMNCFRRVYGDPENMNISDFENNTNMNAMIRVTGNPNDVIKDEVKQPLGQDVLSYWEMLNIEKDDHLPTPRAYTGVEGAKDERTYRGKQLKVNQASKQILMMMRGYMEEVFGPLFQDILDCLAKFMKKKTTIRYLSEDFEISPDDVICKYALVVNVGLGSHDKQDLIVKLQQLIGLGMKEMQTGIVTAQNLYYMNSELVKAMGFLNTTDFVTDPQVKQMVMQLIQEMSALLQMMGQSPATSQVISQIMPGFQQTAQKIMALFGEMPGDNKGGENTVGTQEGELPAEIPGQAMNPMLPQEQITGGGFFA